MLSDDASGRLFITADAGQNLFPSGGRNCRENFRFHFFSTRKATSFNASSRN